MRPHGTRGCYQIDGCRCDACRAAEAAYHRRYRASEAGHVLFFGSAMKTAGGSEPTGRLESGIPLH